MLSRAHASRSRSYPALSILKYVIVGDAAVGKSCLLVRLTDDKFASAEPTLGVEFGSKILTVGDEGKRVKVQCELRAWSAATGLLVRWFKRTAVAAPGSLGHTRSVIEPAQNDELAGELGSRS